MKPISLGVGPTTGRNGQIISSLFANKFRSDKER